MNSHKQWLDNEYSLWCEALDKSDIETFKDNPMVMRMLSELDENLTAEFQSLVTLNLDLTERILDIDNIGRSIKLSKLSGSALRMVYYAQKVLATNPSSIIEIGGGVGEFCAILYAIGYRGIYYIYDLGPVKAFQNRYLRYVESFTGLHILPQGQFFDFYPRQLEAHTDLCVSFYALGEFNDDTKEYYVDNVIKMCKHGFVIWNPHSGASKEVPFECTISPEYPLTHPDNLQLIW